LTGRYDPEQAAETVRILAATTDVELAAGVRAAAAAVLELAAAWRHSPVWSSAEHYRRAYATAERMRVDLAELPDTAPLRDVVAAVAPVLNGWWPTQPAAAAAVGDAVEELRRTAMHRPSLVRDARTIARS
jgi:hypothetical protein